MTNRALAVTAWGRWGAPGLPGFWALGSDRREAPAVEALAVLARHCLDQARLAPGPRVGLVLGVGSALGAPREQHARAVFSKDPTALSPRAFLFTTINAVAARVSILLGLTGESLTLPDPAAPFWAAADLLRCGRADAVLVGGAAAQADGSEEIRSAALVCLESAISGASPKRLAAPSLRLCPATTPGFLPPADEGQVVQEVVRILDDGGSGEVDCGRRGRILVNLAAGCTEEHTA